MKKVKMDSAFPSLLDFLLTKQIQLKKIQIYGGKEPLMRLTGTSLTLISTEI